MFKGVRVKMDLKSSMNQRFIQHFLHVMSRGNDKGTRHIKQLVSLFLLWPHWVHKKQVLICHSGKVTTTSKDWCLEIASGPPTILSEECSFSSISVCWFFEFCLFIFFLAATLAVTNSVRNKASKNEPFAVFYWFGQTIPVSKCFHHHIHNCNFSFAFSVTFFVKPITNSP